MFVASDGLAIGTIEACAARGVQIPADLAIIGFDNIWVGAMHGVQLSTVDSRAREIGREAAKRLVDKIQNRWSGDAIEAVAELRVLPRPWSGDAPAGALPRSSTRTKTRGQLRCQGKTFSYLRLLIPLHPAPSTAPPRKASTSMTRHKRILAVVAISLPLLAATACSSADEVASGG